MKMDWDDVRVFLALARAGSLTAAARSLRVEHTTVARRIAQLEQALGLHLFDRLPRGWILTSEGEQLAARAAQMEEQAHEFMREAADGALLSGTVRLSASPSVGQEFLLPRLCAIHQRWASITLELVVETRVAVLSRREADLALRIGRPQDPGLAARLLGTMAYGLYCRRGYTDGRSEADWRFIGYDDSLAHAPEHLWLESLRGSRGYALRANTLPLQRDAVRMGLGLAVLPHFMAAGDAQLERLPLAGGPAAREIWLVVHPDVRRSPRVRLIADLLVEVVSGGADVLAPSFD
nr:LysR family transcriptional regulator [uncultured Noviherbaspirillum sp.]